VTTERFELGYKVKKQNPDRYASGGISEKSRRYRILLKASRSSACKLIADRRRRYDEKWGNESYVKKGKTSKRARGLKLISFLPAILNRTRKTRALTSVVVGGVVVEGTARIIVVVDFAT